MSTADSEYGLIVEVSDSGVSVSVVRPGGVATPGIGFTPTSIMVISVLRFLWNKKIQIYNFKIKFMIESVLVLVLV